MKSIVILSVLFGWAAAIAQDTVLVRSLPEIVVTATRSAIPISDSPSPVSVIPISQEAILHGHNVADVLRKSNSVFLQDLGGSASLKTAFLRGTAPQHLLVLVNGIRQNSFQNGLVDFSLFPLNDVQRIEIVRGGSSALYGADALGGVVNIFTRRATSALKLRADAGGGSHEYARWRLEGQGRPGGVGILAGASYESGQDDFPFRLAAGGGGLRENSDFRKRQIYLHGDMEITPRSGLSILSQVMQSKRGVPGSLSFPSTLARQEDEDANLNVVFYTALFRGARIETRAAYHYSFQTYVDPNPSFPVDARYINRYLAFNTEMQVVLAENHRVMIGVELDEGSLDGSDFSGRIRRTQKSAYISDEVRLVRNGSVLDLISLYGMIRYDAISDVDNALMPKIGGNVRILKAGDLRFRASYGTSFRSPSFNDLYYVGVNNPDLRPEYSASFDAGFASDFTTGHTTQRFEVTYFDIRTRDRILFDLATFRPVNIGRVASTGVEVGYGGSFFGFLDVGLNYTLNDAIKKNKSADPDPAFGKQLRFLPKHTAQSSVTVHLKPVKIAISHMMVGERFTTDDHTLSLPEHHLIDAAVSTTFPWEPARIALSAEVRNIFDRSYQVFPDYPMPGRTLRVGIGVEY